MTETVRATYLIEGNEPTARAAARRIAYEQTVELPESLITRPDILADVVGEVESVVPAVGPERRSLVTLAYPTMHLDPQLPALLNLLFGNASMLAGTRLVDIDLPPGVLDGYAGPRYGVDGVRRLLGVHGRPLLATAVKPRGMSHREQAALCEAFALGGGDLIKDDQNLADDFETFKRRAQACFAAVQRANERTGRRCLYLPHASARFGDLERCFEFAAASGIAGLLVCPMVLGLETVRGLGERYPLLLMAHPGLSMVEGGDSVRGISPHALLGTLFRLAGSDISIFPHQGGRFPWSLEDCQRIAGRLREPLGSLRAALPSPAGGMTLDRVPELCEAYGEDSVLLVGGALFALSSSVSEGTQRFLDAIRAVSDERLAPPEEQSVPRESYRLGFTPDFQWHSRESSPYKSGEDAAFEGVRRVELVGKFGERTRTDLRYFEVAPGGFSSLERHVHGHIVIGARGRGVLVMGDERQPLEVNDVAFIGSLQVHQLRNDTSEPFGFFCIVDRKRDRPMRPDPTREGPSETTSDATR